ncbi:recombination-associated protein rdgC, partial [Vibrio parahaemolyticus AQ3810]
QKTY